ncbi:MAG: DUF433 domain-containing protein [Alphaproteobacteria bacterium]|nr:DUF433 domain-containing protein [Alphaproteobacteria bacterium]
MEQIDWSQCQLVESVPDRLSGAPVIKNTRLPVRALIDNYDDKLSPAEIIEQFPGVTEEQVLQLVDYARQHGAKRGTPRVPSPARS